MLPLCGKPLIGHILERVKRAKSIDEVVLATSALSENDPIADVADDYGVSVFRGSEDDLLDRYYQAAVEYNADVVLRLPADNVCSEPAEFDRLIKFHLNSDFDFTSNICNFMGNGYPDGIGVEAIAFAALKHAHEHNHTLTNREHVATNFYDYINHTIPVGSHFTVGTIACPKNISRPDIVLDVNTQSDYELMKSLYQDLYPDNTDFSMIDIIKWFDAKKGS